MGLTLQRGETDDKHGNKSNMQSEVIPGKKQKQKTNVKTL